MTTTKVREIVGVFHDADSLYKAADQLMISGFDRSHLSLLASRDAVERRLGHRFERVLDAEDDLALPRLAYVGTDSLTEARSAAIGGLVYVGALTAAGMVVASGGALAATIVGAAAAGAGGGVLGVLLSTLIGAGKAHDIQDQLEHGGLLLWVRVDGPEAEARAARVLRDNGASDVHGHDLPAPEYAFEGGESQGMSFMRYVDRVWPKGHGKVA